jgi:hypothetical protein
VIAVVLVGCGGFLLGVLWMDLMFDVQVLRYRQSTAELPESVLASIAAYYHRVTTTAKPMGRLIGAVMATAVIVLASRIAMSPDSWPLSLASLVLCCGPILLAFLRVYPNAVRLAARSDSALRQSSLARSVCSDHLICFAGILGFVVLQVIAAAHSA